MSVRRLMTVLCVGIVTLTVVGSGVATMGTGPADQRAGTELHYQGERLTLHPQPDQVVEGSTAREVGQSVTVRLQSSGAGSFVRSTEATVDEDGRFAATFDLREVGATTEATATVYAGDERLASPVPVAIVEAAGDAPVTATADDQPASTPGQPGFAAAIAVVTVLLAIAVRQR